MQMAKSHDTMEFPKEPAACAPGGLGALLLELTFSQGGRRMAGPGSSQTAIDGSGDLPAHTECEKRAERQSHAGGKRLEMKIRPSARPIKARPHLQQAPMVATPRTEQATPQPSERQRAKGGMKTKAWSVCLMACRCARLDRQRTEDKENENMGPKGAGHSTGDCLAGLLSFPPFSRSRYGIFYG